MENAGLIEADRTAGDDNGTGMVSIVLPVYNESETIAELVQSLLADLGSHGPADEIIIVDDGSDETTQARLRQVRSLDPDRVRVIRHLRNRGNGAALRTGIRSAVGEIVVTMDADGQHRADDIPKLLEHMPPYDLVIGARKADYPGPFLRNAANRFYNTFASLLSRHQVMDLTSGFRAMRRQAAIHFLPLFPEGFSAPTTTTLSFLKAGYNVKFVPIDVGARAAGQSKIRPWQDGIRFISLILRMIMLYDPLRIFLPVGGGLAALGALAWVAGLLNAGRLVFPNSTIFLFSAAITVWMLGLIAEQIGASHVHYFGDETRVELDGDSSGQTE